MDEKLRNAWTNVIIADELDSHLENLGQAEVNAKIVEQMITDYPLPHNLKILMPGCGTGQIFDYLPTDILSKYEFTFTDINMSFLEKLRNRLENLGISNFKCLIDDLEETTVKEKFDGIIPVLLLEQLDWKKACSAIISYDPQFIYLVIQEQSNKSNTITVNLKSGNSIIEFSKMALPTLVDRNELTNLLSENQYNLSNVYEVDVPNQKVMVGLVFYRV